MKRCLFFIFYLMLFVEMQGISQSYHTASISINQPPCSITSISPVILNPIDFKLINNTERDMISIELLNQYDTFTLILSDVLGKKIKTINFASQKYLTISTSGINEGLYFISIFSQSYSSTKKVAIIR